MPGATPAAAARASQSQTTSRPARDPRRPRDRQQCMQPHPAAIRVRNAAGAPRARARAPQALPEPVARTATTTTASAGRGRGLSRAAGTGADAGDSGSSGATEACQAAPWSMRARRTAASIQPSCTLTARPPRSSGYVPRDHRGHPRARCAAQRAKVTGRAQAAEQHCQARDCSAASCSRRRLCRSRHAVQPSTALQAPERSACSIATLPAVLHDQDAAHVDASAASAGAYGGCGGEIQASQPPPARATQPRERRQQQLSSRSPFDRRESRRALRRPSPPAGRINAA